MELAELTRGTGHYNITRGLIITAQGVGAALSNVLAAFVVHAAGYNAGFLSRAVIATAGLVICYFGLTETRNPKLVNQAILVTKDVTKGDPRNR
jgi:hypothetical protein